MPHLVQLAVCCELIGRALKRTIVWLCWVYRLFVGNTGAAAVVGVVGVRTTDGCWWLWYGV